MGNSSSGSAGSLSEHVAHASRTGVCALQSRGLNEVDFIYFLIYIYIYFIVIIIEYIYLCSCHKSYSPYLAISVLWMYPIIN